MKRSMVHMPAVIALVLAVMVPAPPLPAQYLPGCQELAFSTEEDFVTQGPEPADGNPVISDGDLLGMSFAPTTQTYLCARNSFLLQSFQITVDLGLDAVDVISLEPTIIAFSTELDGPGEGLFTAGDLLITTGLVIPHDRLTYTFFAGQNAPNLGLDAVHFVGALQSILSFISSISATMPTAENFATLLTEFQIDIWFSTEQNARPATAPLFLDGDLLSARFGTVVAANSALLPAAVPAGIPVRGADFGLDAATAGRDGQTTALLFSTEIVHPSDFTDGDVLLVGTPGIVFTYQEMIQDLEPLADFVGLDALYFSPAQPDR